MSTGRHDPTPRDVPAWADAVVARPHIVAATHDLALAHAARRGVDPDAARAGDDRPPHPGAPTVGARSTTTYVVDTDDTAAAIGHPDPSMLVLSSPTLSAWFELSCMPLMPSHETGLRNAGVGILVHHLDGAVVGDEVVVVVEVVSVAGRAVRFACDAFHGERLLATGVHHRVLIAG